MKPIIIAALMLSALTVAGQELKKVIETHSVTPSITEKTEYYVLADAKKVKHGLYKKWVNNILIVEGYYKNNQRDSTWIRYGSHLNPLIIWNYDKGEKVGISKYYLPEGELEQEYDFTKRELVYFKPENKGTIHQIINSKDTIYAELSQPPINIGGHFAYFETVAKNLRYSFSEFKSHSDGRIFVSFIIDEKGKRSHFKVVKKGNRKLDEEAIRLIQLIEDWLPAMKDGKPVKVIHIVPITFDTDEIIEP